jgi:hypothetical protein
MRLYLPALRIVILRGFHLQLFLLWSLSGMECRCSARHLGTNSNPPEQASQPARQAVFVNIVKTTISYSLAARSVGGGGGNVSLARDPSLRLLHCIYGAREKERKNDVTPNRWNAQISSLSLPFYSIRISDTIQIVATFLQVSVSGVLFHQSLCPFMCNFLGRVHSFILFRRRQHNGEKMARMVFCSSSFRFALCPRSLWPWQQPEWRVNSAAVRKVRKEWEATDRCSHVRSL